VTSEQCHLASHQPIGGCQQAGRHNIVIPRAIRGRPRGKDPLI
jgi:hypothetical protein